MASVIDVNTLSKNEIILLIKDLLDHKIITHQFLSEVAEMNDLKSEDIEDMAKIEALINKHFDEYDEVFRKLA